MADGVPHLRIENRVLPAGPVVVDEMANAAFWLGLMQGMASHYNDITEYMPFDQAKNNFLAASMHGLDTRFRWLDGKRYAASELIREELLPIAREGLKSVNIKSEAIEKYLGIMEERNNTGSHWMVQSFNELRKVGTRDEVLTTLTASIYHNQLKNIPVHHWAPSSFSDNDSWRPQERLVEEFMTTDLFTVQKSDILEFVADMMDWKKIRYMPAENNQGRLEGLITSRLLLRHCTRKHQKTDKKPTTVKEVMIHNPITITPEANIFEAMSIMEKNNIGCLPVMKNKKLVGIITAQYFLGITRRLMSRLSKEAK